MVKKIGAHVSTAGGLDNGIKQALAIGANCLQIFSSPPQQWVGARHTPEAKSEFLRAARVQNLLPVFIHGTYLINFATENPFNLQKSISALVSDLQFAGDIGSAGVVFHFGSHPEGWTGKRKQLVPVFREIISNSSGQAKIIIENSAGSGSKIGAKLEELAQIREDIRSDKIVFCLDTAHAFASGYDLRTAASVEKFVLNVDKVIGWDSVAVIHVNDSRIPLGGGSDRHENIGQGHIGLDGFRALVNHSLLANIPCVLEVPGFDGKGPDAENIRIIKSLAVV